jgi:hypothetical protein
VEREVFRRIRGNGIVTLYSIASKSVLGYRDRANREILINA